jgi:hypothetical protein
VKDVGPEFVELLKEQPAVVAFQQGDVDSGVPDDLYRGRDQRIDFETRRAHKQDGNAFIGETHKEKLEIRGVFGDGPGGRYKGNAWRQRARRLQIRRGLLIRHNILSINPFRESIL